MSQNGSQVGIGIDPGVRTGVARLHFPGGEEPRLIQDVVLKAEGPSRNSDDIVRHLDAARDVLLRGVDFVAVEGVQTYHGYRGRSPLSLLGRPYAGYIPTENLTGISEIVGAVKTICAHSAIPVYVYYRPDLLGEMFGNRSLNKKQVRERVRLSYPHLAHLDEHCLDAALGAIYWQKKIRLGLSNLVLANAQ